jgi:hypothetical protein
MSISGVSAFTPMSNRDVRAEFERQREIHAKGPAGSGERRAEETGPRPSVGASALADPAAADPKRSAALQKIDISV